MGKGLSVPVRVNQGGGAKLEEDPFHLSTVLRLALSAGDDDNPFQNLGIDQSILFAINDSGAQATARNIIKKILNKFSDRLKLDESRPVQFSQPNEGELEVSFRYINLDNNESTDFSTLIG